MRWCCRVLLAVSFFHARAGLADEPSFTPAPSAGAAAAPPEAPQPEGGPRQSSQRWRRAPNLSGAAIRSLGVRAVLARADGTTEGGAGLYERGLGLLDHLWLSARYLDFLELGGDTTGFRYRADAQIALGPALRWNQLHSSFVRPGIRAHVARSADLYTSDVRFPEIQLGHRIAGQRFQFDLAAHGSYVLVGRFSPPGSSLKLGDGWAFGTYASAGWEAIRLDFEWSRMVPDSGVRADDARAHLCWLWTSVMACLDGRVAASRRTAPAIAYDAGFVGVSLLFGQLQWI